jgi:hypothetical protein
VAADVVEQCLHMLGRALAGVLVELQMPVSPVDAPEASRSCIAQSCDWELCPVALTVPGWACLDDGDVPVCDVALNTY